MPLPAAGRGVDRVRERRGTEGGRSPLGRVPRQRTTLYGDAPIERRAASFGTAPLTDPINTPARRWERHPENAAAAD